MYLFAGGKDSNVNPVDFLPQWWKDQEEEPTTTADELRAKASMVMAAFGGVDTLGS